jgi:hypothetical protein
MLVSPYLCSFSIFLPPNYPSVFYGEDSGFQKSYETELGTVGLSASYQHFSLTFHPLIYYLTTRPQRNRLNMHFKLFALLALAIVMVATIPTPAVDNSAEAAKVFLRHTDRCSFGACSSSKSSLAEDAEMIMRC